MLWLDKYERYARVAPGLLALLPITVTITALGFRQVPVISVIVSVLSLGGGPVLLADTVRQFGQRAQYKLWHKWGGAPTTLALRLREPTTNSVQRDLWRNAVEKVTDVSFASRASELRNPKKADEAIETAVARLRQRTWGDRFILLQAENRSYGFQRNLYGIRWFGRLVAFIGILVIGGFVVWHLRDNNHAGLFTADLLGLVLNAVILAGWFILPSPNRVRQAGDKYAHQLLHAAVNIAETPPTGATNAATDPGATQASGLTADQ